MLIRVFPLAMQHDLKLNFGDRPGMVRVECVEDLGVCGYLRGYNYYYMYVLPL